MRRVAIALLACSALTCPALAEPARLSPEQIGEIFCLGRLGNDMAAVDGLLTPALRDAIVAAEARNAQIAASAPDEKPPLGDGIPWQSWPDYADSCIARAGTADAQTATVSIDYGFTADPEAGFTDTLHLNLAEDSMQVSRWRIDNVGYATKGDLRDVLAHVAAQ